jgi:hypothetical protein
MHIEMAAQSFRCTTSGLQSQFMSRHPSHTEWAAARTRTKHSASIINGGRKAGGRSCPVILVQTMRMLQLPEEDMAMLTGDKAGARLQVTFMGAALQPEKLQERMRKAGFAKVVGFRPTGSSPQPPCGPCHHPSSERSMAPMLHCVRHRNKQCLQCHTTCELSEWNSFRQNCCMDD